MIQSRTDVDPKNVLKIAGAYIAWVIGAGFATGQEVLQFFSSYGYMSYGAAGICLVGFVLLGYLLMRTGFENRDVAGFDHFRYYCGETMGKGYSWLVFASLMLIFSVLISGGGAALHEYYSIPKALGSAILAVTVLVTYMIGFEKMVSIISKLGPLIILFSLLVGIISLLKSSDNLQRIPAYEGTLTHYRAAPNFWLSGLLYLGLTFFPGSTYFTHLGTSAASKEELKLGALCGGLTLLLSITVMSTAIMLNGSVTAELDIPVLYLAGKISKVFGAIFSVMLVLGIFSACSAMMWSVCSRLSARTGKNTVTAVAVAAFGFVVSLFPFGSLLGTIYPIVGYIGLIYLACVIWKGTIKKTV